MSRWPTFTGVVPAQGPRLGRVRAAILTLLVALAHLWLANLLAEDRFGWGQGESASRRISVSFVKELAQATPLTPPAPAATPVGPAGPPRLAAVAQAPLPNPAASAASPDTDRPETVAEAPAAPAEAAVEVAVSPTKPGAASMPETPASDPAALPSAAPVAAVAAATLDDRTRFEWPPSTRLSYRLLGNYRGPVEGRAQVEWLHSGTRYQVHLEASVAPFLSRRISSEGEVTERGLAPQTTQGEQRVLLRTPRRWTLKFSPDKVVLADGRETDTLPGAQDEASQFVQLTWLFTTQPALLKVGQLVQMPLALSRRLEVWTFEVMAQETLELPFGEVATYHVKPRREFSKGSDMVAQMWFAPSLQFLPVRILIHQDAETWIDLQLEKPPLQAAR